MLYIPQPIGRICRKCGIWKPAYLLKKNKQHTTGYDALCLQCHSQQMQKHRTENPELAREKDRQYRQDNLGRYRERDKVRNANRKQYTLIYNKQYNAENKDQLRKQRKQYEKEHPEVRKKANEKWQSKNVDKVREIKRKAQNKRRTLKRGAVVAFTATDWQRCLDCWRHCCAYCDISGTKLTQDHFIPLALGGSYTPDNILPACPSCNSKKNNHEPIKWVSDRFGKAKIAEITAYFASL